MPDRIEAPVITCQANVTAANPTVVTLPNVVACQVVRVAIRIPAGHAGLTGIALGYGGQAVLPRTTGQFISGDDEVPTYDLSNYEPGPQWEAFLINLDTQAHVWQVRFEIVELFDLPSTARSPAIPPDQIVAAAGELIAVA